MPPCGRGGGGQWDQTVCGGEAALGPQSTYTFSPHPLTEPHTCVPMRSRPALTVPSGAFIGNKATLLLVTAAGVLVNTTSPGGK